MASALANWKRLKWIKPDESLSAESCSPKLGFEAEQRVNHCIAINQEPPDAPHRPLQLAVHRQLLEGIPVRPGTKLAALVVALRRPHGATNLQLTLVTGWQPHSVRGAISGLLRKRLGLNVVLTRNAAGERVYRIG
jgi:hypothetical protein